MMLRIRGITFGVVLSLLSVASLAVQVAGSPVSISQPSDTASVVERGGTISAIDSINKVIVIDGVRYPLSATTVTTHALVRSANRKPPELQVGMQVRFNTSKFNFANQEQVTEIWITKDVAKSARK
ncbi:hypothetical protein [Rhodoferax sp. PAMC 29310]|uniref:hypothetical protein n=1 Tax=Rhodoferax sp. PAMC 29310 TaxID=2822760 RepID=UPI001B31C178|nr:hypothetical protein [Rhodoferax sp. PAMC 29310]